MIDLISITLIVPFFIIIGIKIFQKWCLWFVFDYEFKDENSRLCKISQKLAPYLLGIGLGRFPRKVK